ncbi:YphA family membrane protein [Aquibacillus sediminis]|uniref:YphA family membrane protein n=1 Tax=Aquibacillus sediminis TaxID=2574734 RepID=UPI00110994DA|nr:hypothetical protein [Aquibacillus sediminis]
MDGLLFYWICWMIWIYVTFIMKKHRLRDLLALWLLFILIFSSNEIMLGNISINMAVFVLFFGALLAFSFLSNWLKSLLYCLCLVFGYIGILFWEQISPVWMVAPRTIIITIIGFFFLLILTKQYVKRCIIWCLGLTTGEVIHGLIMNSYSMQETIGDMAFMDIIFLELATLSLYQGFVELQSRLDSTVQTIEQQK